MDNPDRDDMALPPRRHRQMQGRPGVTLAEAKVWLRQYWDEGADCPCCTQLVKVYRRQIHAIMARDLIRFYRKYGTVWGERMSLQLAGVTGAASAGGDFGKLRYWDLIEEADARRPDGGRAGWYQVTSLGEQFVLGSATVKQYVHVYDGRRVSPFFSGATVNIANRLGKRFNYDELMGNPF